MTVRLALGPSDRTEVPLINIDAYGDDLMSLLMERAAKMKTQPHSPRAYPSARSSNVWHRPELDSIPAKLNAFESPADINVDPEESAQLLDV